MHRFVSMLTEDHEGIQRNIPNRRYWKWEINELGFRGKAIELEKKEGQIRIVFLGGSETFGLFERNRKEWPAQPGKMIHDKFPRAEVINAAVTGLKPSQRKEYVKRYILPLKPDILILHHHRFSIFVRNQMRGISDTKQAKADMRTTRSPGELFKAHMWYISKSPWGQRYLPRFLFKRVAMRKILRKIKKREKKFLAYKEPLDEVPQHLALVYEKELKSFCDYLKENSIIPVLSTFPYLTTASNKDKYKYELLFIRRYCVELSEKGILDGTIKMNEMIRRVAEEQHTFFIDNDHLIPKTKEYFVDNYHYTNKGAEVIARNYYHILNHAGLLR